MKILYPKRLKFRLLAAREASSGNDCMTKKHRNSRAISSIFCHTIVANAPLIVRLKAEISNALGIAYLFAYICLILTLTGCGKNKEEIYNAMTDVEIYTEAVNALKDGNYEKAIEAYEQLDAQYPFGEYTEQGHLEIIYAYYQDDELPASLAAADRFIRLHPRNPHIDYAYYMRGLIKFGENNSLIDRFLPIERGLRDLSTARDSYNYFSELVRLYPESPYSVDARQRMLFIRNVMAYNELAAAKWYMKRKAYLAAANRAQYVIEHFPEAPAVPGALRVLAQAYTQLGLDDLAKSSYEILEENYPDSEAAEESD